MGHGDKTGLQSIQRADAGTPCLPTCSAELRYRASVWHFCWHRILTPPGKDVQRLGQRGAPVDPGHVYTAEHLRRGVRVTFSTRAPVLQHQHPRRPGLRMEVDTHGGQQ